MRTTILAASLLATALAGCSRHVEFRDNFSALFDQQVQRPYAVGTTARVTVRWSTVDHVDDWTASSEDPAVVRIVSQGVTPGGTRLEVDVEAMAPGETQLTVTRRHERIGSVPLRVAAATQLQLLDHALQKTKHESSDVGAEVRVVVGQPIAVETRYLTAVQERAWGRDLVTWPEVPDLLVWTDAETLGADAEYLLVQPAELGTYDLPLSLHGQAERTLRIVGVAEADIDRIELLPPPESDAREGDSLCGGLLAYDAAGHRVFGAPADWTIGDETVGAGDLLCYTYAPNEPAAEVTVRVGATGAQLLVRGRDFHASSTATIGCSVAGAGAAATRAASGVLLGLLFLAGAVLLRRILR